MTFDKKLRFYALGCLFIIHFFLFASPCLGIELSGEEREYLRAKGSIVFVSQTRYPPFEFTDESRQHEGMMLDVIRWMAVEVGFQAVFTDMTFKHAQEAVLTGEADVLTSLFYSDQRNERFEFTATLFDVPASIFVKAERTDIKDLNDLNGKIIAIQKGDYAKDFLESRKIGFDRLDAEDFAQATDIVIAGQADAVIGDEQIVLYHIFSNRLTNCIKKIAEPLYIGKNCMASNKNNAMLIGILNKGIQEARRTGVLNKISTKWLGTVYGPRESFLQRYIWPLSSVAIGLLLLSLAVWIWNVRLRALVRKKTEVIIQREQALRESEEKFRNLMEYVPGVSIQGYKADGTVIYWNRASEAVYGYGAGEALGRNLADLIIPENLKPLFHRSLESAKEVRESGEFMPAGELLLRHKDGRPVPVHSIHTCVHIEGSEPTFFCIDFDLSERKRAEEALRRSEQEYRTLVENASELVFRTDDGGHFTFVNPATLRITGYEEAEIIGKHYSMLIRESMRENVTDLFDRRLVHEAQNTYRRFPIVTKEGRDVWLAQNSQPLLEGGRVIGFQAVARDITESNRAEEALRRSEEKYRHLFETLIDVYFRVDAEGRVVLISPSITKAAGYQPEEVLGMDVRSFYLYPEERDRFLELLWRHGAVSDFEVQIKKKDGSGLWVSFNARIDKDRDGNILGIEGIARDITERRRTDEALRAAVQEKEVLLREIHHRVKNNMQVISSLLTLQAERLEHEQARQGLLQSQQRIVAMAMIHEALYRSPTLASIDLPIYVKTLIDYLREVYGDQTGVHISLEITNVELGIDQAVPCGLILNELITNAFKHAFHGVDNGTIHVKMCSVDEKEVILEVCDNGLGLAPDLAHEGSRSLGFRLVRGLVKQQLKGSLEVATDGGTTFRLSWPLPGARGGKA